MFDRKFEKIFLGILKYEGIKILNSHIHRWECLRCLKMWYFRHIPKNIYNKLNIGMSYFQKSNSQESDILKTKRHLRVVLREKERENT